jgi:NAD+ diphosphatase
MSTDNRLQSERNTFAGSPLDRQAWRRRDSDWLEKALHADTTRFVPVWRQRHLLNAHPEAVTWSRTQAEPFLDRAQAVVFLGQWSGFTYFALDLSPLDEADLPTGQHDAGFSDLLQSATGLGDGEAAVQVQARAMLHWHNRHRFCGRCGSQTESRQGGYARVCLNPDCARQDFPRVDPAMIALVFDGDGCLLGRQARWPEGRFSTLAGFVEPGESVEDAVAREVAEETGVQVGAAYYHSSQPWPFPASLMMGYHVQALTHEIKRGDDELAQARWFTMEEMRQALANGDLRLPPAVSIAYRLIEAWFDARSSTPLAELTGPGAFR